jgi:polysaccharide deacetylase family protein (PEP-CTERM system associated)
MTRPTHAFTVDLEEWFHGIELPEDEWPTESRLQVGLERLIALLDAANVRATFFVLGVVAERFPELVADLDRAGHEIACRSHRHRFIYQQSRDEFRDDLKRSRDAIASAIGRPPRGFRAPYFSIRQDSLWALDILGEEGFAYDSSVFPVRNYRYGIPDAPRTPYDVDTSVGPLREVPLTPARVLGQNVPYSGGAYLRILPWWVQRVAWSAADRGGRSQVAYIHPWELDPEHPRIPLPRRVAATHYVRLDVTERRLARLFSTHRFGRLDEVFALA